MSFRQNWIFIQENLLKLEKWIGKLSKFNFMEVYREKLIMTYKELISFHQELLTRIINVGMTGEMEEINEIFEKDDQFQFDKEMFRGTKDQNLNLLLELHDNLEDTMNSFANINNITQKELDDFEE